MKGFVAGQAAAARRPLMKAFNAPLREPTQIFEAQRRRPLHEAR
jgi:hypothetical protein